LSAKSGAEEAIRLLQDEMARAFSNREFDAVMRCYAGDAVLLAPGRPAAVGSAAIALELRAAFADPDVEVAVRSTRIDVSADERMAAAWGSGLTTITDPATGRKTRIASKWLAVYRREGDGWKVAADAFNADDAMP
jgi:uncharacterized protein (TIGR02246 family)